MALPLALGWRGTRGGSEGLGRTRKAAKAAVAKQAFAELCAFLDRCNAEDKAAGRPPMIDYLEAAFAWKLGGLRWNDR